MKTKHPPRIEGAVTLSSDRRLGFAEFGVPDGLPVFWFHGTPGARRQIPPLARRFAVERGVRLIGVDRPGVGNSTPHLYSQLADWPEDIETLADHLAIDKFGVVGLSGGGPYVLSCAHAFPKRVVAAAVVGGVAPTQGPDAVTGGPMQLALWLAPLLRTLRQPLGSTLSFLIRALAPLSSPAFDFYMMMSPEGDRKVFARPGMKEMFLDDLSGNGSSVCIAPIHDLLLFGRDWGFRLKDIRVPVRLWHGDSDHLVPLDHAHHQAKLLRDSEVFIRPGESHLGGLDAAEEILEMMLALSKKRRKDRKRVKKSSAR